ncbi:hypothetical protein [Enterovirga rhinocerotis]|uniref:Uncharacterized protein n=1 Tax=Enterovirga rhinocerotis TaxID=1339210 RepID=A0A4R7C1C5_9HYPH|nr:hypothetical protein [Enterovirga rhinocerotis]TDR90297.1 hypothetical protein EV668_3143 [Enterovirga rhinocerotis]
MTPAAARAMYARQIAAHGENVTFRRVVPNAAPIERTVRIRLVSYGEAELVGGVNLSDRKAIVMRDSLHASGFPLPFRRGSDKVIIGNTTLTVNEVDDTKRRVAGELIAYELLLGGAALV